MDESIADGKHLRRTLLQAAPCANVYQRYLSNKSSEIARESERFDGTTSRSNTTYSCPINGIVLLEGVFVHLVRLKYVARVIA